MDNVSNTSIWSPLLEFSALLYMGLQNRLPMHQFYEFWD